jgi:hypothetical protein
MKNGPGVADVADAQGRVIRARVHAAELDDSNAGDVVRSSRSAVNRRAVASRTRKAEGVVRDRRAERWTGGSGHSDAMRALSSPILRVPRAAKSIMFKSPVGELVVRPASHRDGSRSNTLTRGINLPLA